MQALELRNTVGRCFKNYDRSSRSRMVSFGGSYLFNFLIWTLFQLLFNFFYFWPLQLESVRIKNSKAMTPSKLINLLLYGLSNYSSFCLSPSNQRQYSFRFLLARFNMLVTHCHWTFYTFDFVLGLGFFRLSRLCLAASGYTRPVCSNVQGEIS